MTDLAHVLKAAVDALRQAGVDALLIGGFAVNHYGFTRSTADIDFMMALDRCAAARRAMVAAGFENVDEHDTVAFYRVPGHPVRVDLLKVDQETMQKLMERAVAIDLHGHAMKVPALEDLIAMKLFALKHGWVRRVHKDLPDVIQLVRLNKLDVTTVLKPLALRFADPAIFEKIAEEIARTESP
jgi:predicted nucleotidyltransferase